MKYNLAFKYRIYPNKEQELLINKTFGCVRFVYNTILYTANKFYEETGKNKIITPASFEKWKSIFKRSGQLGTFKCSIECKTIVYEFFSEESEVSKVQI